MIQSSGARSLARRVLVVDDSLTSSSSAAGRSVRALVSEFQARGMEVVEAVSCEDGEATVVSDAGISCILLNWTQGQNDKKIHEQATELLRAVRSRNAKVPIFLMASRKLAGTVSVEVATLADEFIWVLEDTASFICGRVQGAIERYVQALLPPDAAALARYDRERAKAAAYGGSSACTYRSIAPCTRPQMKDAVSSRTQMNSSASVATSTLTVPASLRLAMRKIGTLALRLRTARNSSVACS